VATTALAALHEVHPRVRFWRPLRGDPIDILCFTRTAGPLPPLLHEALEIMVPLSSLLLHDGAGRTDRVDPGMLAVIRPLELYSTSEVEGAPSRTVGLLVTQQSLAATWAELPGRRSQGMPWFPHRRIEDTELWSEFRGLIADTEAPASQAEFRRSFRRSLLLALAKFLLRHAEPPRPTVGPVSRMERIREYLQMHVADPVSLDDLAGAVGLSKFYLLRRFQRTYGVSPHAYLTQLRLARARRLLETGKAVSHVAYEAGFADQSHLTRRFKGFFGFTPAEYGRQVHGVTAQPGWPSRRGAHGRGSAAA
jgi:AraC-like DNA-binding protein